MQSNQPRAVVSCPNCGVDGGNRTWRDITGGNAYVRGGLRIRSDAHHFNGSEVVALVCKNCGYVQLFTDPQDFK